MKVEYDRSVCAGWFQCVQKWDAFEMNMAAGKADLEESEETEDGIFVRDIPEDLKEAAEDAANSCPVDAIKVYEDGEQIAPVE